MGNFGGIKTWIVGLAALVLSSGAALAETRVTGAGATFPKPLYLKWCEAYNAAHPDVKLDYTGGGSGAGIKAITDKTAQFAGSDAAMSTSQKAAAPGVIHLPTVAGPVVITYNLPEIKGKDLVLNGDVLVGIYAGQIKAWDDAKIKALNPGLELPSKAILVVHRSDPSGTSNIFTTYLASVSEKWAEKVGKGIDVKWPTGQGGKGNDGVADAVNSTEGGLGYVELAYAKSKNLPFASLVNKDGKTVKASVAGVLAAAASIKDIPADLVLNITNAPGDESYPIAGYTYMLVYKESDFMTKEQAAAMVDFIHWSLTDGQSMTAGDYAGLPKELQEKVLEALKTVNYKGEPLLK